MSAESEELAQRLAKHYSYDKINEILIGLISSTDGHQDCVRCLQRALGLRAVADFDAAVAACTQEAPVDFWGQLERLVASAECRGPRRLGVIETLVAGLAADAANDKEPAPDHECVAGLIALMMANDKEVPS